jgi:hypothetical protein
VQELLKESSKQDVECVHRNDEAEQIKSLAEIRFSLTRLQVMTKSMPRETRVLSRLYFESMYAREDIIVDAESGTFGWIVEGGLESSKKVETWSDKGEGETRRSESSIQGAEDLEKEHKSVVIRHTNSAHEDEKSNHVEEEETSNRRKRSTDGNMSSTSLDDGSRSYKAANFSKSEYDEKLAQTERETRQRIQDSFLTWLKSSSQIYHISGKAGSGKSTLMKFLCHHPRVQQELDRWAGNKKLVFAHFFFWNSGDKLQMSLEGLYRALLFETLKQCPELIPENFPDKWGGLEHEGAGFESTPFRLPEIKLAFNTLIGKQTFLKHRVCFFIDGLDEYEGDSVEHWELARSLQSWAHSEDIKFCVSSRPHTEFLDTFSDDPNLRIHLHELSHGDIRRFARVMFEKYTNFSKISSIYLDLVDKIVEMADGVFLWARLVVRSLLDGAGHHYSLSALQEKLNTIPRGLSDLFDKLFDAIDPGDRKRSDKMLTMTTHKSNLNALIYSWLEDLEDPNFPFRSPVRGYSNEEIEKLHEDLRCQLDSLSKGLLEITHNSSEDLYFKYRVQFFHRTVRDYLQDPSRQTQMKSRLPGFDTTEAYCRLRLAEFKFARTNAKYFMAQGLVQTPLIKIFYDSFNWFRIGIIRAQKLPFNFLDEFGRVLDIHKQLPFSHPEEAETNSGNIFWGYELDTADMRLRASNHNISYLHWVAFNLQHQYVSQKLSEDSELVKSSNEPSLLLTASLAGDPNLVRFLLEKGAFPYQQVKVRQGKGSGPDETVTIWMIFLLYFANTVIKRYYWLGFDDLFLVLEQFLTFRADGDVFFLLCRDRNVPRDDELFFIPLQRLVHISQPKIFESIQNLLLERGRSQLWSQTNHVISRLTHWIWPSTSATSKYKAFEFSELGKRRYKVHSVCSKTSQLRTGFKVRVW